jgi:hypothetical protein
MSKVMSVASLVVAIALIFMVIKQKLANNLASFLSIASLVLLLVPFGPFAYWTRSEPYLILISALSLLVATQARPFLAGAILGALAGLAAGFKLHGFLYVAPLALMTLARVKTPRDRATLALIGVICVITFALLPFCLKASSLAGYSQYLNVAADHALYFGLLQLNLLVALVLFAPIVGIWFWRKPTIEAPEFWLITGLCISVAITVVLAGVSGPYHLLPFVPICLYAAIAISPITEVNRIIAFLFLLLVLAYGPGGYFITRGLITSYYRRSQAEHEKIVELQTYLNKYPDAQMGISDDGHSPDTNYRILSVLDGHPLHVDFAAWDDLAYVGVDEKYVSRFIKKCEVPTWILPLGAPFTELSWYTKRPILSDDFRRIFSKNYALLQIGQFYQVWGCRKSAERAEEN